jgi:hypothetical protein
LRRLVCRHGANQHSAFGTDQMRHSVSEFDHETAATNRRRGERWEVRHGQD